jgi:O-antigen/teichoic acid export membrane protein
MNRRWMGELTWVVFGKISSLVGSMVLVKLLTQSLDLDEFAKLTLGLTVCNLFTSIIMGALGQGIGRVYVDVVSKNDFYDFKKTLAKINRIVLLVYASLLIFVGVMVFLFGWQKWLALALILMVYSYVYGLNDISMGLQNLARNRKESVLGGFAEVFAKIAFIYWLMTIWDLSVFYVIVIYIVSSLVSLSYQASVFKKLDKLSVQTSIDYKNKNWQHQILSISTPAAFAGVFVWLQQASDKWALNFFHGSESVAQYTVVYQLGYAPFLVGMGVVMSLLTPVIYKAKQRLLMNKLLIFVFLITAFGVVISAAYFEKFFELVIDSRYSAAAKYLPFMLVSAGFFQAGEVVSSQLMSENRSKDIFKVKMLTAFICLVSNVIGSYFYGITGIVGSMIFFGTIYFAIFWTFLISKKTTGVCNGK